MSKEAIPRECPGPKSETAGKASSCDGCPNKNQCATGEVSKLEQEEAAIIQAKLSNVKYRVIVMSGKGGVGKTSVTSLIAHALSKNYKVGVIDADICGPSGAQAFGLMGEMVHNSASGWSPAYVNDNLCVISSSFLLESFDSAVIWRGPKKNVLIKKFLMNVDWPDLDYLLIDTPPGTSDEHLSLVKYIGQSSRDASLIVTTPSDIAMLDVKKEINFCKRVNLDIIGVIENMSVFCCPHCQHETNIFRSESQSVAEMCDEYHVKHLGGIPLQQNIAISVDQGVDFFEKNQCRSIMRIVQHLQTYMEDKNLA